MAVRISNETKVGAFATIAIILLILGYNILKGNDYFSNNNIYYARFSNLEGLAVANKININGLAVGRVKDLQLLNDSAHNIIVVLSVSGNIKIPVGSVAIITSVDLLGTKAIDVQLANSTQYYKDKDTLISGYGTSLAKSVQAQVEPLTAKTLSVLTSLDTIALALREVLNDETKANLRRSIASLSSTLNHLSGTSESLDSVFRANNKRLDRIFANIESITNSFVADDSVITRLVNNLAAVSDSLKRAQIVQTVEQAKEALAQTTEVMQKINSGQGSLALLVNDDKLYNNLQTSAKSLNALLADVKANPKRYVHFSLFGKKEKPQPVDSL